MTQVERKVTLLSHTQLAEEFREQFDKYPMGFYENELDNLGASDGQVVALSAVRTCYSANKPSEIVAKEGVRYFRQKATDGKGGTEADRLIRMITSSKHLSTVEHLSFTFAVEGVSRALLAQLTRHRVGLSFSVQSQRYVKFGSDDRSGGFDYVVPDTVKAKDSPFTELDYSGTTTHYDSAAELFEEAMEHAQHFYDKLRAIGVPTEDARAVLPNAAACNLVLTVNLRSLLDFYGKRKAGNGAQAEIAGLAEDLKNVVVEVEPWTSQLFKEELA